VHRGAGRAAAADGRHSPTLLVLTLLLRLSIREPKKKERPAFVAYATAGFPTPAEFVDVLLGLQAGGADIIEIGEVTSPFRPSPW
jgi:hypothetical protein